MNFAQKSLALALIATASGAGSAGSQRIEGVGLQGQAEVTIVPADRIDVRIQRDARREVRVEYQRGSIRITGCMRNCNPRALPRVEVRMPKVSALAVHAGGSMRVGPGYAALRDLAVAVDDSGLIDAMALDAQRVAVSVEGVGEARVRVRNSLAVSAERGGRVFYAGSPPSIASSARQGGRVQQIAR